MEQTAKRLLALTKTLTAKEIAMSADELLCFLAVAVRPGMSVGELVTETGLPQSTVSRHLKRLSSGMRKSKGELGPISWELEFGQEALLEQRVHPDNPKQKALHLAAEGQALMARFEAVINPNHAPS